MYGKPRLRGLTENSITGNSLSSLSNPYAQSTSSGDSQYFDSVKPQKTELGPAAASTYKESGSGWSVVDAKRRPPGAAKFNAWDPSGTYHSRIRLPSTTASSSDPFASTSSVASESRDAYDNNVDDGGWAKPVSNCAVVRTLLCTDSFHTEKSKNSSCSISRLQSPAGSS
jgi:hypothetical protein